MKKVLLICLSILGLGQSTANDGLGECVSHLCIHTRCCGLGDCLGHLLQHCCMFDCFHLCSGHGHVNHDFDLNIGHGGHVGLGHGHAHVEHISVDAGPNSDYMPSHHSDHHSDHHVLYPKVGKLVREALDATRKKEEKNIQQSIYEQDELFSTVKHD